MIVLVSLDGFHIGLELRVAGPHGLGVLALTTQRVCLPLNAIAYVALRVAITAETKCRVLLQLADNGVGVIALAAAEFAALESIGTPKVPRLCCR